MDADTAAQKREVRRTKLKIAAQLRAEINYRHALERVDHRIDVVEPAIVEYEQSLTAGEKTLEIEA